MSFSRVELQEAETAYLSDLSDAHLERYYNRLMDAAPVLLKSYGYSIGFRVPSDRINDLCHDATTRLLEGYWKRPEKKSIPVAARLFQEVRYQLNNRTKRRYETTVVSLADNTVAGKMEVGKGGEFHIHKSLRSNALTFMDVTEDLLAEVDEHKWIREVLDDSRVDGQRVIMTIFNTRHYRTAVKKLVEFTPRAWIYNNAVKLHTIYKMTRGK